MERVCFLHIGTHKTATASMQIFLTSNEERLEQKGIFIPRSGRPWPGSGGHHNLAWELNGDPRFDPAFGSWHDILTEIRSRDPATVCLSSEDFEHLYRKPDSMHRIRQELKAIDYDVKVAVYLRPQADYLESLYVELLKNGGRLPFRDCLGQIFDGGANASRDFWARGFDYLELLDSFAAAFGKDRIVACALPD